MKIPAALIALSLSPLPNIATAGTVALDASSAHNALNGMHYACDLGDMKFDMVFEDVATDSRAFPYEFRAGDRTSEDAYIIMENGDIHLQSANEKRYLTWDNERLNISKSPDGRAAICTAL